MFRAKRKDNGNEVKGDYCKVGGRHFIIPQSAGLSYSHRILCIVGIVEIDPATLAEGTGVFDNSEPQVEICGSFLVDGKMSNGGDEVASVCDTHKVVKWVRTRNGTGFNIGKGYHKIIGPACDLGE